MEPINLATAHKMINSIYENSRDEIIPHLRGSAGIGKTSIVYQIAEEHNVKVVELICSQITYTELSGMPMPLEDSKTMDIYDNQKLLDLKDGDILFLDEFDKSDITVRQAVLKLLQERALMSGKHLPDILIVAASNRTEEAESVDDCIRDRFFYLDIMFDKELWCSYIEDKYHINVNDLVNALDVNDVTENWNTLTPRTAEKLINYYSKTYNNPEQKNIAQDFIKNISSSNLFIGELFNQYDNMSERNEILSILDKAGKTNKEIKRVASILKDARVNDWYSIIEKSKSSKKIKELLS